MTTIAYDGITIAGDGRGITGETITYRKAKKIVVRRGIIYAFSGTWCLQQPVIEWCESGCDPEKIPKLPDSHWSLLVIDQAGCKKLSTEMAHYSEWCELPVAIGSGRPEAMAAMMAGACSRRAVEIAGQLDGGTGGEIQVVDVAEALGAGIIQEAAE